MRMLLKEVKNVMQNSADSVTFTFLVIRLHCFILDYLEHNVTNQKRSSKASLNESSLAKP